MRKVEEYEQQAAECRRLAAQATKPEERKRLEDQAQVWERLAGERRHGVVENDPGQGSPQIEK